MANYFELTLDTTSPTLNIVVPQYTSPNIYTDIKIYSNETLMDYQDIYIIDNVGNRHDLIFDFDDNKAFIGKFTFNEFPLGFVTIYVQLKDDVANLSSLYSKTINIVNNQSLTVDFKTKMNEVVLDILERDTQLSINDNVIELDIKTQEISISTNIRECILEVKNVG